MCQAAECEAWLRLLCCTALVVLAGLCKESVELRVSRRAEKKHSGGSLRFLPPRRGFVVVLNGNQKEHHHVFSWGGRSRDGRVALFGKVPSSPGFFCCSAVVTFCAGLQFAVHFSGIFVPVVLQLLFGFASACCWYLLSALMSDSVAHLSILAEPNSTSSCPNPSKLFQQTPPIPFKIAVCPFFTVPPCYILLGC